MKTILVLGAGRVARPCVHYLLEESDYRLTVADQRPEHARAVAGDHPRARAVALDAEADDLPAAVRDHDIVVNLLPAGYLTAVAELCVGERTHMIGATYVTERMQKLHPEARDSDTLILTEVGLDPGIDHMMAAETVDRLRAEGAEIEGYRSLCGAIPAHEANDNPLGYKFSWSPEGALGAARRPARYLREGETVQVPGDETMRDNALIRVPGCGWFEYYPNGDALPYRELYGIPEVRDLYRGTYRFPGWCETLAALIELGFLSEGGGDPTAETHRELAASLTGTDGTAEGIAARLGLPDYALVVRRIEWLGWLDDAPLPAGKRSPAAVTAKLMLDRLTFAPDERDMVVMTHEYVVRHRDGGRERIFSTLVERGEPGGDTAIARTTGLPVAIACDLVLRGEIELRGVQIPVHESIYEPSLRRLAEQGLRAEEKRTQVTGH